MPLTQLSFLRLITSSPIVQEGAVTNRRAIEIFRLLRADRRWLDEPIGFEDRWFAAAGVKTRAPKLWMDACLAAFAIETGTRLVTFDRGFKQFTGLDTLLLLPET